MASTMHPAQVRANRLKNDDDFFSYIKKLGSQAIDAAGLDYFKSKANFWATKVKALVSMKVPASLEAERKSLLSKAVSVKNSVEKIMGNIPSLQGVGLGIWPVVIGVAVVASAVSAMANWIIDYNKFLAKLEAAQKAQASGLTPQQSAEYVQSIDADSGGGGILSGGIFGSVKKYAIPLLLIGGVALFLVSRKNEN